MLVIAQAIEVGIGVALRTATLFGMNEVSIEIIEVRH